MSVSKPILYFYIYKKNYKALESAFNPKKPPMSS